MLDGGRPFAAEVVLIGLMSVGLERAAVTQQSLPERRGDLEGAGPQTGRIRIACGRRHILCRLCLGVVRLRV